MAYRDDEEAARAQIEALAQDRRAQERRLAAIAKLCAVYIKNVCAWTQTDVTGDQVVPDEQLMRSIEDRMNLGDAQRRAFRREIALFVDALRIEGKPFEFRMHAALHKALELVVAEQAIGKLSGIVTYAMAANIFFVLPEVFPTRRLDSSSVSSTLLCKKCHAASARS